MPRKIKEAFKFFCVAQKSFYIKRLINWNLLSSSCKINVDDSKMSRIFSFIYHNDEL